MIYQRTSDTAIVRMPDDDDDGGSRTVESFLDLTPRRWNNVVKCLKTLRLIFKVFKNICDIGKDIYDVIQLGGVLKWGGVQQCSY